MIAPPHVQAQSFARAILTDITASLFQTVRLDGNWAEARIHRRCGTNQQMQTIPLSASAFTILMPEKPWIRAVCAASVPLLNSFLRGVNAAGPTIFGVHG
jgi:hypothetical protein